MPGLDPTLSAIAAAVSIADGSYMRPTQRASKRNQGSIHGWGASSERTTAGGRCAWRRRARVGGHRRRTQGASSLAGAQRRGSSRAPTTSATRRKPSATQPCVPTSRIQPEPSNTPQLRRGAWDACLATGGAGAPLLAAGVDVRTPRAWAVPGTRQEARLRSCSTRGRGRTRTDQSGRDSGECARARPCVGSEPLRRVSIIGPQSARGTSTASTRA